MKVRSRKYKYKEGGPVYWPSFVDVMTTVTLVFFFIMILAIGFLTVFVDDISAKRADLYDKIQIKLDENNVDKNIIRFNREEGRIEVNTETFFDTGSYMLKKDGVDTAKMFNNIFYDLLKDEEILKQVQYIEIVGHTDYLGSTFTNRELSTRRAINFLNEIVPMNSNIENEFGGKFKASGMSEFETNVSVEERNKSEAQYDREKYKEHRKIEVRMIFNNQDLEEAIKQRLEMKKSN